MGWTKRMTAWVLVLCLLWGSCGSSVLAAESIPDAVENNAGVSQESVDEEPESSVGSVAPEGINTPSNDAGEEGDAEATDSFGVGDDADAVDGAGAEMGTGEADDVDVEESAGVTDNAGVEGDADAAGDVGAEGNTDEDKADVVGEEEGTDAVDGDDTADYADEDASEVTNEISPELESEEDAQESQDSVAADERPREVIGEGGVLGWSADISWNLDIESGYMSVEGTGDVLGSDYDRAPWYEYKNQIKSVKVDVTGMTDASYLFYECENLTSIDLSGFDTSQITDMSNMFSWCYELTSLDLRGFDTSQVKDMSYMFDGCENLVSINLSSFDTTKLEDAYGMFRDCSSLTELDLSNFNAGELYGEINGSYGMFDACVSLTKMKTPYNLKNAVPLPVGSGEIWLQPDGTEILDLPVNLSESIEIVRSRKEVVDGESIAGGSYEGIAWAIDDAGKLTVEGTGDFSDDNSNYNRAPWSGYRTFIKSAQIVVSGMTDASYMFCGCINLESVDMSGFDTSQVISMYGMFHDCSSLAGLDLSGFKTGQVTSMDYMFYGCENLLSLDLRSFDTSQVTSMESMFWDCSSLTTIDLSSFNTEKVGSMYSMFSGCNSLTNLNLNNFNTKNVTHMNAMFEFCSSLTSLDLSSFTTNKVTAMEYMFWGCSGLTDLNLSGFDISRVEYLYGIFDDCTSLVTIHTPTNTTVSAELPVESGEVWTMPDGTEITELPKELSYSVVITKSKKDITHDDDIANGSYKGIVWAIDANGKLTVTGTGDFSDTAGESRVPWYEYRTSIKSAEINVTGMNDASYMFDGCENLVSVDVSGFDTSQLTSMYFMFNNCNSLISLDLSGFDVSQVTTMGYMFMGCSSLTSLDLGGFSSNNVTNINGMFSDCSSLISLDLSGLNGYKLTQANNMLHGTFYNCSSLMKMNTPYNLRYTIPLPAETGEIWTQPDGTEILDLPIRTSESIEIVRSKKNIVAGEDIASGSYEGITWTLDGAGKLTVEGTGDFSDDSSNYNRAPWSNYRTFIKSAKIDVTGMTNASYMFYGCVNLASMDLSGFDTSKITSMMAMFFECSSLENLDVSSFNTGNVKSMWHMFDGCSSLRSLDLSSFDTRQVQDMYWIFNGCSSLSSLDLRNFYTGNINTMHCMFAGCSSLTSLDLSSFDTSNVTIMSATFSGCSSLTSLNLSSFDTSKVTSMWSMFRGCNSLTSLDLSSFDASNVEEFEFFLSNCTGLTSIHTSCNLTKSVELPIQSDEVWKMPDGTETTELPKELSDSVLITKTKKHITNDDDIANGSYKDIAWAIDANGRLTVIGTGDFSDDAGECRAPWYEYRASVTSAEIRVTDMTDASYMFEGCENLESLDLRNFDTKNVQNMKYMFFGCNKLCEVDLSRFDTSKVTNMNGMFCDCLKLTSLDVSRFNTSLVTDMDAMFCGCISLTDLDVSNFDTSNVTDMSIMFKSCSNLTSLNVKGFDTSKAEYMGYMFWECWSLTALDLSSFDMSSIIWGANGVTIDDYYPLLNSCPSLVNINTPRNLAYQIALPVATSADVWEQPDGTVIQILPQNLSESMVITRKRTEASIGVYSKDVIYERGDVLNIDDFGITVWYYALDGTRTIVTDFTTNADEIDMSTCGTKKLVITYQGLTKEIEFTVTEKSYGLKIQLKDRIFDYTGSAIKPEIMVTKNGRLLVEGKDYTVKYSNNVNASTDSKKATVTVTGKGNLSGKVSENFTIRGINLASSNIAAARIIVIAGKKVSAPILYYGSVKLTAKDFTYDKNKTFSLKDENPKLTVTAVSGRNFYGTRDIEVKVVANSAEFRAAIQKFTVEIDKEKANKLVFSGKNTDLSDEIFDTIIVKDKISKRKIEEQDENGVPNYRIALSQSTNAGTVKLTAVGMGDYSGCTITKSVRILSRTISSYTDAADQVTDSSILLITDEASSHVYKDTGAECENMILKWKEDVLTEGKDYTVSYSGNKRAGSSAKCTITFKGNYKGKVFFNFSVDKAKLSAGSIDQGNGLVIPDMVCNGKSGVYKSKPYVSIGGAVVKASEYTVKYYIDEARTIEMSKANPLPVAGKDSAVVYVEIGAKEKNYTTPAGEAPITGSYTVFARKSAAVDLSKAKVTFYSDAAGTSKTTKFGYTGNQVIPEKVVVEIGGKTLSYGTDYTFEIVNNVNRGKATVIIKSMEGSNYIGSKTAAFSVTARNISNYTIL